MDNLGKYLKQARRSVGYSQGEISDALGYTSSQFVSNWERGVSCPTADAIDLLAKNYKLDRKDLCQKILDYKVNNTIRKFNVEYRP